MGCHADPFLHRYHKPHTFLNHDPTHPWICFKAKDIINYPHVIHHILPGDVWINLDMCAFAGRHFVYLTASLPYRSIAVALWKQQYGWPIDRVGSRRGQSIGAPDGVLAKLPSTLFLLVTCAVGFDWRIPISAGQADDRDKLYRQWPVDARVYLLGCILESEQGQAV